MIVTPAELAFYAVCTAIGAALGIARAAYLIRKDDLLTEYATVLALPDRKVDLT